MLKRFVFSLCALMLCAGSFAHAQDVRRSQLITAEAQLNDAIAAHDAKSVEALLTYDYMLITASSAIMDRDDLIKQVQDRHLAFKTNHAHDQRVRFYGDGVAIVTGVLDQDYTVNGQHRSYSVRYTDAWVREGNIWRQASGHASPMQATTASTP